DFHVTGVQTCALPILEVFAGGGAGGGFSDFFEELFGRRRAGAGPHAGPGGMPRGDTRARVAVPLEAVHAGTSVRISLNGRTLDVKVPRGIRPGQVVRLKGQGSGPPGAPGDLLLEIEYAAHPRFEVDG